MENKYILTDDTLVRKKDGVILHRIKAIRDFGSVKAGTLGGWIEKYDNLSHSGTCWVYGEAKVYGDAFVCGDARILDHAQVYHGAMVCDNARVYEHARIYGNAQIFGNARVYGDARVYECVRIFGNAKVYYTARVFGDVEIRDSVELSQNAYVSTPLDYILIGPLGSRDDSVTFYRNKSGGISVVCGCFNGTIEQFKERVKLRYIEDKYNVNPLCYRQYMDIIQYVINIMRYHWRINKYGKEIYNDR